MKLRILAMSIQFKLVLQRIAVILMKIVTIIKKTMLILTLVVKYQEY